MNEDIIFVKNLVKEFKIRNGKKRVLDDLSFSVKKGDIVGFIGPNGAGKTTTIKTILNLIKPTAGEILILGKKYEDISVKEKLGYMPEKDVFYDNMYPLDFLIYLGILSGMDKKSAKKRGMDLLRMMGLDKALNTKIKNFSSGMKKKIFFMQSVIHNPELLVLDEPTANLDPLAQEQILFLLKEFQKMGTTIFVSSHNIEELEKIVDHILVINHGKLIMSSSLKKLKKESEQGIEINTNDSSIAAKVLLSYNPKIIDSNKLLVKVDSSEKNNIIKLLLNANLEINSISEKKQNLWNIILGVLKENE